MKQADLNPTPYAPAKLDDVKASFSALETAIYGSFTPPTVFDLKSSEVLKTNWLNGKATVERRIYSVSHGQTPQDFEIIFVTPTKVPNAPLIVSQNFSSNIGVIAENGVSAVSGEKVSMGVLGPIFTYFFGRYIVEPPLEYIIDRGYGFAAMHPPDYIADRAELGTSQLDAIFGKRPDRPGALTIWASLTTALAEDLKTAAPTRPIIAMGHSRYGKTALLAAAYGMSVDAAIAHQSGTAGASLMRDKTGESIKDVVRGYPQWLVPSASDYAENPKTLPTDAHALLAYISPKPILLGNARRDVWSDPEGAYQAAKWASQNTDQTFAATRLDDFIPDNDIAIWTRPGTHGVVKEDWPAFLDFMDAHFK
ncbi:MAG: hypothetical protein ABJO36_00495 [Litorimonas sp.]